MSTVNPMNSAEILNHIRQVGIVPIIRATKPEDAIEAAHAIAKGGIDVLEVTMTVPGAIDLIKQLSSDLGDQVILGAGTVLDPETARACILAGAQFIVTPATNFDTITLCRRYGIPIMPGALTPTEIVAAWQAGADMVKVFPCSSMGGASYLKNLKAPFPQIDLIPTGGVNLNTIADFIKAGATAVGVGADLVDLKLLQENNSAEITSRARKYREIIAETRAEIK